MNDLTFYRSRDVAMATSFRATLAKLAYPTFICNTLAFLNALDFYNSDACINKGDGNNLVGFCPVTGNPKFTRLACVQQASVTRLLGLVSLRLLHGTVSVDTWIFYCY